MPRQPPVTKTMPSAVIAISLVRHIEQPMRDQLLIGRNDMIGHRGDGAAGIGIAAAEVTARAHQYLNDSFEFLVAIAIDGAGMPRPLQDADIGGRNVVKVLLVADRGEEFGLVENAQELRDLADEIEEGTEAFDFLPRGL